MDCQPRPIELHELGDQRKVRQRCPSAQRVGQGWTKADSDQSNLVDYSTEKGMPTTMGPLLPPGLRRILRCALRSALLCPALRIALRSDPRCTLRCALRPVPITWASGARRHCGSEDLAALLPYSGWDLHCLYACDRYNNGCRSLINMHITLLSIVHLYSAYTSVGT